MPNYTDNTFTVRAIPGARAAAAFSPNTSEVFKEEHEVAPVWINKKRTMPWHNPQYSLYVLVIRLGFEPRTHSLEGCCSNPTELPNQRGCKVTKINRMRKVTERNVMVS